MAREIEKTEDGVLTEEQSKAFMLAVADLTVKAFQKLGNLTPEEMLATYQGKDIPETYVAIVNAVFQDVVEADMPQAFNDYIHNVGVNVVEKTFNNVAQKNNDNIAALLTKVVGVDYNDMSPKDVIECVQKLEAEV